MKIIEVHKRPTLALNDRTCELTVRDGDGQVKQMTIKDLRLLGAEQWLGWYDHPMGQGQVLPKQTEVNFSTMEAKFRAT